MTLISKIKSLIIMTELHEYNNQINHNEYGTHEFDFSTLSFIYGEERDPQTDFTPPELPHFDFISVSATK